MSEVLPEGWAQTTLGNIANWGSGGTPSRSESSYYGGTIPWVKTGDLGSKYLNEVDEFITEEGLANSSAKLFPKGSVVLAMYGATIGKTSILNLDATTNQACAVGQPINGITFTNYLYYLLCKEKESFIAKGKGGAQPNISQFLIKAHEIQFPPLAEQQEIATHLDDLLAQVDTIKARLDAIPAILKRFRQSVLAAAVSGKLFKNNTWEASTLAKIADSRLGKMLDKQKNQGSPHLYLRNVNVRWFNFDLSDLLEIKVSDDELEQLYVRKGDILVCEGGEPGRCAIWKQENNQYIFQKALHRVRVKNGVLPEWICFILKDAADTNKLDEYFTGTTIKHLTGQSLKQLPIPLPSLEEQTEIVRRVEQLFTFAEQIEQQVQAAQARVNNLTQAILAKAFKGELTADWRAAHPELISGENSAQALLDKIKAIPTPSKPKRSRAQQAELF